jgi:hypothetical protein
MMDRVSLDSIVHANGQWSSHVRKGREGVAKCMMTAPRDFDDKTALCFVEFTV